MKKRRTASRWQVKARYVVLCAALVVTAVLVIAAQRNAGRKAVAPTEESAGTNASFFVRECRQDITCGNALLYGCEKGNFIAQARRQKIIVEVLGLEGARCLITAAVDLDDAEPFALEDDDSNDDGALSMSCRVPLGFSFEKLTAWLEGDGLTYCEGEYRNFMERLSAQLGI